MTLTPLDTHTQRPLRLWPGVAFVTLQWLLWFVVPAVVPGSMLVSLGGGMLCAVAIVLWWLFFSRAPWSERIGALVLIVAGVLVTKRFVDASIAGAGQGMLMYISTVPGLCLALVAWTVVAGRFSPAPRRAALVAAVALGCAPWLMLRTAGVVGGAGSELHWRWTPTPEQRLLAGPSDDPKPLPPAPAETPAAPVAETADKTPATAAPAAKTETPAPPVAANESAAIAPVTAAEWPGFRGTERDGVIHGVRIKTDWSASPPSVMWRRAVGPGWSSFAVRGDLLYTQEQRGEDEIVACYRVSTGEPVWRHRDRVRFWESNGGAGPRATPTIHGNRIYAFGATGILNALDARTGAVVWTRNAAADTKRKVPDWGFSSSPLVYEDLVVVAVSGTLAAYDMTTGRQRWVGPQHGGTYSSPQLVTIDDVPQIVLLSPPGAVSVKPSDGTLLWQHEWEGGAIVQPAVTEDGDVLINAMTATGGQGTRRVAIAHGPDGWTTKERWTSNGLKPYFNDFVVHKGHAYGFDGSILSCINLEDGSRTWKGGRYGNGQLVLLADQDLLLVLSEEGELVLVSATPDQFKEVARVPALDAKTWNHPVIVRDTLLIRNGEEMIALRLSLEDTSTDVR